MKLLPDRREYFGLISKFGFTENLKKTAKKDGILLFTLDDYIGVNM